jgi:hypothetical protein
VPETSQPPSSRRRFIQNVVGGTAAIAATGAGAGLLAQQGGGIPTYPPPQGGWDLSWTERVEKAKHRVVFDSAAVGDGIAFTNAQVYMAGFREVYNAADADMAVVLVIRHEAIQMAVNDALWERARYGEQLHVNDPGTSQPALRNIWVGRRGADGSAGRPGPLDGLLARGAIVLCCNLALMRAAGAFARAQNMPVEEARKLFIDSLVPGVIRQTSGIFAVARAQAAGAQFIKSA